MAAARPLSRRAASASQRKDADSQDWLRALNSAARERQAARARLHALLLEAASGEARRRWPEGRAELHALASQAATGAVTSISSEIDGYRGDSRFTTWAYKYVICGLSDMAGRQFWQTSPALADHADWNSLAGRPGAPPVSSRDWREACTALRRAVDEELAEGQRAIFTSVTLGDLPAEALTNEFGTSRNSIYQALFEARRKVGARLVADGILANEHMTQRVNNAHWLVRLLAADPGDTGCEVAFQSLDRYAEADLDETAPENRFSGVAAHLACCLPCGTDYLGLLTAARR
jgi:RNA polymerase sigma-70 factor, ECF subfamily